MLRIKSLWVRCKNLASDFLLQFGISNGSFLLTEERCCFRDKGYGDVWYINEELDDWLTAHIKGKFTIYRTVEHFTLDATNNTHPYFTLTFSRKSDALFYKMVWE